MSLRSSKGSPTTSSDATALIRKYAPGETVQLDYLRGSARQSASVTLAAAAN